MSFSDKAEFSYLPFEAYKGSEPYIFISYAHKDRNIIYPEIKRLNDLGFRIWYDEGIDPGTEWTEEIAMALDNCLVFLVFISSRAVKSHNVKNEIGFVVKRNKIFIAIHIEETILPKGLELQISNFQAVIKYELTDEQYHRKLDRALPKVIKNEPREWTPDILIAEETYAGGAWGSTKRGLEWTCQDIVIASSSDTYSTFLLADGTIRANGSLAIAIASDVFAAWQKSVDVRTLSNAKDALCNLLLTIHKKLLEVGRGKQRSVETTAIAVAIYKGGAVPVVLIIPYGNSGCLVTYEEATKGSRLIYSTQLQEPAHSLGSYSHAEIAPQEVLVEVPLTKEGIYYVRSFSDGVEMDSTALSVLVNGKDIRDIVYRARDWPGWYPQIGVDDWSVAGFDIVVRKEQLDRQMTKQLKLTPDLTVGELLAIATTGAATANAPTKPKKAASRGFKTPPELQQKLGETSEEKLTRLKRLVEEAKRAAGKL
jgi:hypothetical protein